MEIQTFMLCKSLDQIGAGNEFNAHLIGLHSFYALDGSFPLEFDMPYFMLLRRADRNGTMPVPLRFSLINPDGRAVGQPNNLRADGLFPAGHLFMTLTGSIHFKFDAAGDYRLDITSDEDVSPFTYQYNIEITR
jgi:hypothetical protein